MSVPSPGDALDALEAREIEHAERERRETGEGLEAAHASLLALLENTDDFVLFSDCSGTPIFFNSAYAQLIKQMLGLDMKPGIKPHELLADPAARAAWDGFHRRVLGGERFAVEVDQAMPDGELRHFEVRYNPVLEGDRIVGFSEFSRDITDRKRADAALRHARDRLEREVAERTRELRESESRFRALTERSADMTLIGSVSGTCRYASPSVRQVGYEPADIVGKTPGDFAHPEDVERIADAYRRAAQAPGTPIPLKHIRTYAKNGEIAIIDGTVTAHLDVPGIEGLVLNVRDVTEHDQLEARLRQAEKMDAIGQLAGGIAHDFNNQLTGILAHAGLLAAHVHDPTLRGWAEQIEQAALRSADLTGKLLAFARKGHYRSDVIDVGELLADVAGLLERSIDKRIRIELDRGAGRLLVMGDPSQLQNAILNLGLNARDAMPDGGNLVLRVLPVELDAAQAARHNLDAGAYLSLSVIDDGVGMDAATQNRMFEPFFTTKPPGKGTGMGLASVYGTVRSHGGAISAESSPGAGTTFSILLPETRRERARVASPKPPSGLAKQALRVLVVDDEPPVRRVLTKLLETLGHSATACSDGVEAVELFGRLEHEIDLVILDMMMPRMNGRETFMALRERAPELRVLISSGFTVEGGAQDLLDRGASGFLKKPFDLAQLALAIEQLWAD